MEEGDGAGRQSRLTMVELFAAATGASLQIASDSAGGTLAGAVVPAAVVAAFRIDESVWRRRAERAARTLEVAADQMGVTLGELEERALRTESSTSLVGRVLAASANAVTAQQKIDVLGRVLATGLGEGDRIDEALVLASALEDLEAPHVRVLTLIAGGVQWFGAPSMVRRVREGSTWSSDRLQRRLPEYKLTIPSLLATLERHGLVQVEMGDVSKALTQQREQKANGRAGDAWDAPPPEYDITDLGLEVLRLFVDARPAGPEA